jgi:hypothetical protein
MHQTATSPETAIAASGPMPFCNQKVLLQGKTVLREAHPQLSIIHCQLSIFPRFAKNSRK